MTAFSINRVENCILEDTNRCMTVRKIAAELSLNVSFVKQIIRGHLKFSKVSAR